MRIASVRKLVGRVFQVSSRAARPGGIRQSRRFHCRPELVCLEERLAPATVNWTGLGHDLNWVNGANWDLHVPTGNDDAVIGSNFADQTITSSGTVTVRSVTSAATLELTGGSFSLGAATSVMNADLLVGAAASLQLTNTTLNGTGALTNAGSTDIQTSTVNIAVDNQGFLRADSVSSTINGTVTNAPDGTIQVFGPAFSTGTLIVAHGFTNHGLLDVHSDPYAGGDATLTVTSGTLINAADATFALPAVGGGRRFINANLDNQGTLISAIGTVIASSSGAFTNSGIIEVNSGNGSFTINQSGATSFTNSGIIALTNGNMAINQAQATSTFTNTGTITAVPGYTFSINGGRFDAGIGTLNGAVQLNGVALGSGILSVGASVTVSHGTEVAGANLVNQGTLTIQQASVFSGSFSNPASGALVVQDTLTLATAFTNNGLISLAATLSLTSGTLVNARGATINVVAGSRLLDAPLDNEGTLTVFSALTLSHDSAQHTNRGLIDLRGGDLIVNQSGTQALFSNTGTILASGHTMTINGGQFDPLAGAIIGNLALRGQATLGSGTLPAGAMVILAAATQAPGTTLVNEGTLTVQEGSSVLNGSFTNAAGAILQVLGSTLTLTNGLTNNGLVLLTGVSGGQTTLAVTAGRLSNAGGATIQVQGSGGVTCLLNGPFDNLGALLVNVSNFFGPGLTIAQSGATPISTNSGTITVSSGNLVFHQSGDSARFTNHGTINVYSGQTVSMDGGRFDPDTGTITGSWRFDSETLGGGTLMGRASIVLSGVTLAADAVLVNQVTLTVQEVSSMFAGSFTNGVNGSLIVQGGMAGQRGQLTLAGGFTNQGIIALTSGGTGNTNLDADISLASGTLTNATGATLSAQAGRGGNRFLDGALTNQGTLTVNQTSLTITLPTATAAVTNSGVLDTRSGTVTINGGVLIPGAGTITGPLRLNAGALGSGTLSGGASLTLVNSRQDAAANLDNQGTVTVQEGTSTFAGGFTNESTAMLQVVGGVNGSAAALVLANGFTNHGLVLLFNSGNASGLSAALEVTAGTLTNAVDGTISVPAASGGTHTLSAQLDNQGTIQVSGFLDLGQPSATDLNSGSIILNGAVPGTTVTLTQSGATASFTNSGTWTVSNVDLVINQVSATAVFTNSGSLTISGSGLSATINGGRFEPAGGTLTGSFVLNNVVLGSGALSVGAVVALNGGYQPADATLINQGTLTIFSGTVTLDGSLNNAASATLRLLPGGGGLTATLVVTNGFTNDGLIDLTSQSIAVDTTLSIPAGTLTNASDGTILASQGSGGNRILAAQLDNQGTITISEPLILNQPSANHVNSGLIQVNRGSFAVLQTGDGAGFENTGLIDAAGGDVSFSQADAGQSVENDGTLQVGAGHSLTIDQGTFLSFAGGTLLEGTYLIAGTLRFPDAVITTNAAAVELDGPAATIINQTNADALANLTVNVGDLSLQNHTLTFAGDLTNGGTIEVGSGGAINLAGAYTQEDGAIVLADGSTLTAPGGTLIAGGLLSGTGTINGNVTNAAAITVGGDGAIGVLTINGDYTQTADGNLTVKIGGPSAGSDYDQLVVSGTATLDGTLTVVLVNGFVPGTGDAFTPLAFGAVDGAFASLAGDGGLFTPNYDSNDLTLVAN